MDTDLILRMRSKGRTWSQIAERLDTSVGAVKEAVAGPLAARRATMARTPVAESARGLLKLCGPRYGHPCRCLRKDHEEFTGVCKNCGPEAEIKDEYGFHRELGCNSFQDKPSIFARYISKDNAKAIHALGLASSRDDLYFHIPRGMKRLEARPDMPRVPVDRIVRRAKRKLK